MNAFMFLSVTQTRNVCFQSLSSCFQSLSSIKTIYNLLVYVNSNTYFILRVFEIMPPPMKAIKSTVYIFG